MSEATASLYFYMAGAERRGPFPFDELLQQPLHRQTPVWSRGMSDWQLAGNVPELAGLIPPVPPQNGPGRESVPTRVKAGSDLKRHTDGLLFVNWGMLILILFGLLASAMTEVGYGPVYWVEAVFRSGLILYVTTTVRYRRLWLWAVGGLLPVVWLFVMLVLHTKLKRSLEAAGFRIGFLGRATPPAGVAA